MLSGDRVRVPRRRGPLGKIFGAIGTAVSVSVITVGAMFAAAALNTGLDHSRSSGATGEMGRRVSVGGGRRGEEAGRSSKAGGTSSRREALPAVPYLPSVPAPDVLLGRG